MNNNKTQSQGNNANNPATSNQTTQNNSNNPPSQPTNAINNTQYIKKVPNITNKKQFVEIANGYTPPIDKSKK